MSYKSEEEKRLRTLRCAGIDTEGFGLLNTFFLYDELASCFGWLTHKLNSFGFHKLAIYLSDIKVSQHKIKGFEIRQTISIKGKRSHYEQDCYIHDQDPEEAISYVCEKYNLAK